MRQRNQYINEKAIMFCPKQREVEGSRKFVGVFNLINNILDHFSKFSTLTGVNQAWKMQMLDHRRNHLKGTVSISVSNCTKCVFNFRTNK